MSVKTHRGLVTPGSTMFKSLLHKLNGEVGTTLWTHAFTVVIKLGSSMTITRLLNPEAYGIVTLLMSILVTIELLTDLGFHVLVIRSQRGDRPEYLDTLWTIKLVRSLISAGLLYVLAPTIATFLHVDQRIPELRMACLYILFSGVESFGFLLAVRHQNSRSKNIWELVSTIICTIFSVSVSYSERTHWGMVISLVLNRALLAAMSFTVVPYHRSVALTWDRESFSEIFRVSRTILPSSLVTLGLTQFDKIVLSKTVPLATLGVYGIAQNVASMADSVSSKLSETVIFARHAALMRNRSDETVRECYAQAWKASVLLLALPILLGAHASLVVRLIYDARYAGATLIVVAMCVRGFLINYAATSDRLLLAAGYNRVQVVPSLLRAIALVGGTVLSYHTWGFDGVLTTIALEPAIAVVYLKHLQWRVKLLLAREEVKLLSAASAVLAASLCTSWLISLLLPAR